MSPTEERLQHLRDALASESRALLYLLRVGYSLEEAEARVEEAGVFLDRLPKSGRLRKSSQSPGRHFARP